VDAGETAAKMLVSTSTIANIESGYRAPTPAQAVQADEVFGTPGTFQRHERRMRGIPFSAGFRPFQPHEAVARLIKTSQHSLIPGLFQTRVVTDHARDSDMTEGKRRVARPGSYRMVYLAASPAGVMVASR
jgi:Helix-turn-helix